MKVRIHIEKPTLRQWFVTQTYNLLLWIAEWVFRDEPERLKQEQKSLILDYYEVVK